MATNRKWMKLCERAPMCDQSDNCIHGFPHDPGLMSNCLMTTLCHVKGWMVKCVPCQPPAKKSKLVFIDATPAAGVETP